MTLMMTGGPRIDSVEARYELGSTPNFPGYYEGTIAMEHNRSAEPA